jgi:hypothetical protein
MGNPFENRFTFPPDEDPEETSNTDGASASDNMPFRPTPEQAGNVVDESIPEALPVEDTNGDPDIFRQNTENTFKNYRQHFENHSSFSDFKHLQEKQMDLLRQLSSTPSSAMDPQLNEEKRAVDEELGRLHNQIESDVLGKREPSEKPSEAAKNEHIGHQAPEATLVGYERVKAQVVGKLESAAAQMEDAGLDEDADHFRRLTEQFRKTKKPVSRMSLWYFDKQLKRDGGRVFNTEGEDVLRYLKPKELVKHQREYDLTDHLVLPNYKPSTQAQQILLKSLGIERPPVAKKGHFSTAATTVRGHYEQLGHVDDPGVVYFHFLVTPDKNRK